MDPNKRPETMARITNKELADAFIAEQVELVRNQVVMDDIYCHTPALFPKGCHH